MQAVSISEARKRLFELRNQVVNNCEQVIITHKNGNMVIISMEGLQARHPRISLLILMILRGADGLETADSCKGGKGSGLVPAAQPYLLCQML